MKKSVAVGIVLMCALAQAKTCVHMFRDHVIRENEGNGKVVIANGQTKVDDRTFGDLTEFLLLRGGIPSVCKKVAPDVARHPTPTSAQDQGGAVVLFVKEDPADATTILVAPDARWAMLNVAAFTGPGVSAEKLAFRVYKGAVRAVCILCGAGGSRSEGTLMAPMPDMASYDRCTQVNVLADVFAMMATYLKPLGVDPVECMSYEDACEEGWAPAPTNDVQKAIWDKVHALPTKPITIKPETKPVKD